MAASQASVALVTARTLLNDDGGSIWTDQILMPKLQQAFRELQAILRVNSASVMKTTAVNTISTGGLTLIIADIKEPIRLWEKAVSAPDTSYVPMTEQDPLPNKVAAATLIYWQWDGAQFNFIGASADRVVKAQYWRSLIEPTANTDSLYFIDAEIYLAPRTAALAAGSVGEKERFDAMSQVAAGTLAQVINSNRGRQAPPSPASPRP